MDPQASGFRLRANAPEGQKRFPISDAKSLPFDSAKLDALLDDAGIDALVVTSKHNIQYLLGGYRFFFFDQMDAIGVSRYLPILIYQKGRPADSVYVANKMESYEQELGKFWMQNVVNATWGTVDAARIAVGHLKKLGNTVRRIGVETSFIPADAYAALHEGLPDVEMVDALFPLESLRARKSAAELDYLRIASGRVIDWMMAVFASARPGKTKKELADQLRQEEISRDHRPLRCRASDRPGSEREIELLADDSLDGVAMARIKLNADRLVGYMKTDSSQTNASSFRRSSTSLIQLSPMFWVTRVESQGLLATTNWRGVTPVVTLRNLWGRLRIARMTAGDHITEFAILTPQYN